MTDSTLPLISIIVPTYNEERDIHATLDTLVALDYPRKEVLVVDASTDSTPDIVRSYADRGIRLIPQTRKGGRSEARNEGLLAAQGEIVVILNADTRLSPDFLTRIAAHYDNGADFVMVESAVSNTQDLFPRYNQATHRFYYDPQNPRLEFNWTEGFSCRREAALRAGGFPETMPPMVAGEDEVFSRQLLSQGCQRVFDPSIIVKHVVPADLPTYWKNRVGRGQGGAHRAYLVDGFSLARLIISFAITNALTALRIVIFVPLALRAFKLIEHSGRHRADFLPFCFCFALELTTYNIGLWKGWWQIYRVPAGLRSVAQPGQPLAAAK